MDIWRWVAETQRALDEQGHGRLADLMEALPHAVVVEENHDVEAIVPEALGLARSLDLPWVEIFVRHWYRQGRSGGFEELPDAVDLLEFSHRENNRDCPQSVCTVQDVAIAYAGADGPGFAQERLDVSRETLGRIDPTWPCFSCISSEYASALVDSEQPEASLEFVREQRAKIVSAGGDVGDELLNDEVGALLRLERYEDALERLDAADAARRRRREEEDVFSRRRRMLRAKALLGLGRHQEAADVLLDYEQVLRKLAEAASWVEVVAGLVDGGAHDNDWTLGARIERLLGQLVERGRAWDAVRVASWHGELALARGSAVTAAHALERLRSQAERLRDPSRGRERIQRLEAALAAHDSAVELPETPDALFDALREQEAPDAEDHVERLDAARRRWPDDLDVVMALAAALDALRRPEASAAALREYVDGHPDDRDAWLRYGFALLAAGDHEELEALAARLDERDPGDAAWLRANRAFDAGDNRAAAELAGRVVELHPEARNARRLWAAACDQLGDFAQSLRLRGEVISLGAGDEEDDLEVDHWMRMMSAAAVEDWRVMRESAVALDLSEISGEPDSQPDERWGLIRLRYDARDVVWAGRTGPVTARVIEVSLPGRPQHADDFVVYDPDLIEYPTEETPGLGRVVKVLSEGGIRSFALDGVHPGDERWDAFVSALEEGGMLVDRRSPDEYQLDVDGESRLGVYAMLGVPEGVPDADAHARLTELTAGWDHPIVWIELAEAAGAMKVAERQREISGELGL